MKKMLAILLILITFIGCGKEKDPMKERVYGDLVGAYEYTHNLGNGTPVFRLVTPRGPEFVVGRDNLQWSLDVYREDGVYGKDYKELD